MAGKKGLSAKQKAFCLAYVGEAKGNATEAARVARYAIPSQSGYENLIKPEVLEYIRELTEAMHRESGALTPEEIHYHWANIARDGGVGVMQRLAALRDAARAQGMFVIEVRGKLTLRAESEMSDEELDEELERLEEIADDDPS